MKKLINDPRAVVDESVEGFGLAHADLVTVFADPKYIVRKDAPVAGKVGLVSGGGSGHEPLHGGYVGMGMLDAAVPGAVFTSPTPDQILPATLAVNSGAGVVHIVKNYTGDVLNFETAAELAAGRGRGGPHRAGQRRRRRAGLAVHRRPPGRGRNGAGGEDRRCRRRARGQPRRRRRHR